MAWTTEMVTLVRYLVNDTVAPYTFSDARLQTAIAVSAQLVLHDLTFNNTYIVDISVPTISPDPTSLPDNAFINLISLKTACLMDTSLFRTKAAQAGITVKTGSHSIDTKGQLEGYAKLLEVGPCAAYEQAKLEYIAGNAIPGRAIIGPFQGINLDTSLGRGGGPRERFF